MNNKEDNRDLYRHTAMIATYANNLAMDGNYLDAINLYTEAIGLIPDQWFGLYLNRALCFLKLDLFHLALLDSSEAIKLSNQSNSKCYFIRSRIFQHLNKYEYAEKDLNLAHKLEPDCEEIQNEIERLEKMSNNIENGLFRNKLKSYELSGRTFFKIKRNFSLVKPSNLPTNIWNYKGVRIENIQPDISIRIVQEYFSLFGSIKTIQRLYSRNQDDPNVLIYFFNPVTPMFTIAYFQNKIIEQICSKNPNEMIDTYRPLVLYFTATDDQNELKFSRPKYPNQNNQECYYWRTTSCRRGQQCPRLHLEANKNIDKQIWMQEVSVEKTKLGQLC